VSVASLLLIASSLRRNSARCSNAIFLRVAACSEYHGRTSCDPPAVAIDACGNTTAWALETSGEEPEACCRRCRAGTCASRKKTQVGTDLPPLRQIQFSWLRMCFLHCSQCLASLWLASAKKNKDKPQHFPEALTDTSWRKSNTRGEGQRPGLRLTGRRLNFAFV
jgi:hypothetical protein